MKIFMLAIVSVLALGGCATLKLTESGEKVRVLDPSEVSSCREMGRTNTSITARIVIERPVETVSKELRIIARNSAARMGGDTIVPLTVLENGNQTFNVYKCVGPNS